MRPGVRLGIDVGRMRLLLFIVTSLLVGVVVAVSGAIGFVGLVVPHAVRMVVGSDHRWVLPASALAGGLLLVVVDIVARRGLGTPETCGWQRPNYRSQASEVNLGATSTGPRGLVGTLNWRDTSAMIWMAITFIGSSAMAHAPQDFMGWSSPLTTERGPKPVFRSEKSEVSVDAATDVTVNLKLDARHLDFEALLPRLQSLLDRQAGSPMEASALRRMMRSVLKEVIETNLQRDLTGEFGEIVAAYRDMLERRVASGHDEAISRALTRAKFQSETLASVPMVEQGEACALLGLSDTNPSATLKRHETRNRILRFDWKGKAAYPLFQLEYIPSAPLDSTEALFRA